MSKELATKQEQAVSTNVMSDWGEQQMFGQDIVIPKILPMQSTSDLVQDGKAAMGEFRDSVSGVKLGSISEPVDIIPFHVQKFWDIHTQNDDGNFQWSRTEPLIENPAIPGFNDNLPWEDKEDGEPIKRVRRMNFFVLLPSEVATGAAIPYILSFKSTSFKEGKKLYTQMYLRNRKSNLPPPAYTFKLSGVKEKNDKGSYIVLSLELGRASTQAEVAECLTWFKTIQKGGVKVDDSDVQGKVDAATMQADDTGTGTF